MLLALQRGFLDHVSPADVPQRVHEAVEFVRANYRDALTSLAASKRLSAKVEAELEWALTRASKVLAKG